MLSNYKKNYKGEYYTVTEVAKAVEHTETAMRYYEKGDIGRAHKYFYHAYVICKYHPIVASRVSNYHQAKKEYEVSCDVLLPVVMLRDDDADIQFEMGKKYLAWASIDDDKSLRINHALIYFNKAIELSERRVEFYIERCQAYLMLNDVANAILDYDKIIFFYKSDKKFYFSVDLARCYAMRAELQARLNNFVKAEVDFAAALELAPNDDICWKLFNSYKNAYVRSLALISVTNTVAHSEFEEWQQTKKKSAEINPIDNIMRFSAFANKENIPVAVAEDVDVATGFKAYKLF